MRKLPFILTFVMFLLAGCLSQTTASEVTQKPLLPIYQEKIPITVRYFDFADGGKTFLLAGRYSFLSLYDATTFKKYATIREVDGGKDIYILGAGHIDDNTWYVATGYQYPNPDYKEVPWGQHNYLPRVLSKSAVSIRQIKLAREIYYYDLKGVDTEVFANKNHIAWSWTMLNWHTGESYKVNVPYPKGYYYLASSDLVVMQSLLQKNIYYFFNPLKQEGNVWDFGYSWSGSDLMLSRDANYALYRTEKGRCELWQVGEKKRLGHCGRIKLWGDKTTRAVFRRDSQAFAVSAENKITLYSIEPFKPLTTLTLKKNIDMLAFNEEYLSTIDEGGMLRVWNIHENKLLGEYNLSQYHNNNGSRMAIQSSYFMGFQPGGSKLVVSVGQLLVFDLAPNTIN